MRISGHPRLELIKLMLSEPRRLIVTILIGNEFVNVAASVISAAVVIHFLGGENKMGQFVYYGAYSAAVRGNHPQDPGHQE